MGRPSTRPQRRAQLLSAFARVLADHGYAGATIAAVANEAGVAPGLVHHHFKHKAELMEALVNTLVSQFRARVQVRQQSLGPKSDPLLTYIEGALRLDDQADPIAARCWVGVFAEAVRNPTLFKHLRQLIAQELTTIRRRSGDTLDEQQASAVLAFMMGALVMGAFAPENTTGFAAPALHQLVAAMGRTS